jgi:hypothetical protein
MPGELCGSYCTIWPFRAITGIVAARSDIARARWVFGAHSRKEEGMCDEPKHKHYRMGHAFSWGPVWFAGWLFTIGFVHLSFWKAVLGIVLWPYFLGSLIR